MTVTVTVWLPALSEESTNGLAQLAAGAASTLHETNVALAVVNATVALVDAESAGELEIVTVGGTTTVQDAAAEAERRPTVL